MNNLITVILIVLLAASFGAAQNTADLFIENAELSFGSAFNQAWKYGTPEQKNKLRTLSENYRKDFLQRLLMDKIVATGEFVSNETTAASGTFGLGFGLMIGLLVKTGCALT